MINTITAAEILKLTDRRVRQFIAKGDLVAEKIGRDWMIQRAAVEKLKAKRDQKGSDSDDDS